MIEPDLRPASVSQKIIKTLLKGSLDYKGLVISGPMDGPQILKKYEPESAALQSLIAGSDMLLWSKTSPLIPKAIGLIVNAVKDGRLDEVLIDNAVRRILTLKLKFGLDQQPLPEVKQAIKIEHENEKGELAKHIEKRAITILKNDNNLLPLKKNKSTPLFITGVIDLQPLKKNLIKELKYVNHFEIKTAKHTSRVQDFELRRLGKMAKGVRTALCIFDSSVDALTQAQVLKQLKSKDIKIIAVLLGHPENLDLYHNADALVLLYGSGKYLDYTIDALAEILLGNAPIQVLSSYEKLERRVGQSINFNVLDIIQSPTGRLPISLLPHFPVGHSISYTPSSIKKVVWDFGDGTQSKEHRIEHSYAEPGNYTATVRIKNIDDSETTGSFAIGIN